MARIRSAKPEFWSDPVMCSLPRDVRFTFKGIWEVCADDHGRFMADARILKGAIWPLDDDVTVKKIQQYLLELAGKERILLYVVHGVRYGAVINWSKHQRVSHPTPSRYPNPPEGFANSSGATTEGFAKDSVLSGAERSGEELERSGAEEETDPHAALANLPKGVVDFLGMFYEPAFTMLARERYRDVAHQLFDAMDPKHPGPKIRGNQRSKARSPEHLEEVCRRVMKDPPRDRDKAIVFVLTMLLDPPKGPTVTDVHKATESARIQEEEAYARDAHAAGLRWAKDHPAEYEPLRLAVDSEFSGVRDSTFTRMAKQSALASKTASAAGFPDFDTWRSDRQAVPA